MKKFLTILSLVLALSLCFSALAEETAPAAPIEVETVTEQTATEQAIDAYRALKGAARVKNLDALKTELDAYVTDEKLTQEQANLILKYYTEQFASRGEKQPVNNGKNDKKGRGNGPCQQPTNNGEQRQQRQQIQNGSQQNGGQQREQRQQAGGSGEVDTTSGATTKKGK